MDFQQIKDEIRRQEKKSSKALKRVVNLEALIIRRYDITRHIHTSGCRSLEHTHAWGSLLHDHLLRQICGRKECSDCPTHNIHKGPEE